MKPFLNVLSSGTCEVGTANRFTRLFQNNDMEILNNEPNQASVSEITTSQYEYDYIISCTSIPATMESYIDQSCLECTTLSLETNL